MVEARSNQSVDDLAVVAARGSVRDGLAALQNFENLLRSPRIGPRPLEQVVRELRASCSSFGAAFTALVDELIDRDPDPNLFLNLKSFASSRVADLEASLVRAERVDMGAKARLALEADVRRISLELGALRNLIEMVDASTLARSIELDLAGLISEAICSLAPIEKKRARVVHVWAEQVPDSLSVVADPQSVMGLLGLGIALAANTGLTKIGLVTTTSDDGSVVVVIAASDKTAGAVSCLPPFVIDPSREVAAFISRLLGARFDLDKANQTVRIELLPVQSSRTFYRLGG